MEEIMPNGIVFNIQKFSIHDGPGIRTTVFLKGCPLRCKWCANPESQLEKIQILYDQSKCAHCLTCINVCPQKAITHTNDRIAIDVKKCLGCLSCVKNCPEHALEQEGEFKKVQEVVDVCLQDRDFYEESDGGVTLSGGEVLMHPEFAIALLEALKKEKIHTALETTGFASEKIFDAVTEKADLLLFDMKHWNKEKHIEGTGVSNEIILQNMKRAIKNGKEVLPRLPIIPDFNDSLDDAAHFAETLKSIGASRAQLLPFHQFGERKYELLGRTYAYKDVNALYKEDLEAFRNVFLEHGIDAFF
jgi:pyruvate formate lyase activating enzyme